MDSNMKRDTRPWLILVAVVAAVLLSVFWALAMSPPPPPAAPVDFALFQLLKTVISSLNITLLVVLLATYADIYRKTKSAFAIGLVIFSLILLFHAVVSSPLIPLLFGFRAVTLGPFLILPDLFTLMALLVLLYLSMK
jgi:hypothetical protein